MRREVALRWILVTASIGVVLLGVYTLLFQELRVHVETADSSWGSFTSDTIRHERNVFEPRRGTLAHPFGFRDSEGTEWLVPVGSTFDGASIPQEAWSLIGGPYEGAYFPGSIIHDFYCDVKQKPWRQTHLMFYDAMRAAGVEDAKASLMWGAVRYFGPRWQSLGPDGECRGSCDAQLPDPPEFNQTWFRRYEEWLYFGRDAWSYTVRDEDVFASACDGEAAEVARALIAEFTEPIAFSMLSEFAGMGCPTQVQSQAMLQTFAEYFPGTSTSELSFLEEADYWRWSFDEMLTP